MRWGVVIDLTRCVGCYACVVACKQENFVPPGLTFNRVLITESPEAVKVMYPTQCNHCADPICVEVCPSGATRQTANGIVTVDQDQCVGCRYCLTACPYQVRVFNKENRGEFFPGQGQTELEHIGEKIRPYQKGVVLKCDFCSRRVNGGLEEGLQPGMDREATPACVIACPTQTRTFGDLDDPDSQVSQLIRQKRAIRFHSEHGTDPSVFYILR